MQAAGEAVSGRSRTDGGSSRTREALLDAAERLFAEHGVHAVTTRQISVAAGQGNNAAVNYHFGTKLGLIRAALRRHAVEIDRRRLAMLTEMGESTALRDWVSCAVRSVTDHIESLGQPSWYARFTAHVTADPELRAIAAEEFASAGTSLARLQRGLQRCEPDLPAGTRTERQAMTRHLITHMTAERERDLADGTPTPHRSWDAAARGLIDAITAVWLAPVSDGAKRGATSAIRATSSVRSRSGDRRPSPGARGTASGPSPTRPTPNIG
jgi:AcrR family transcriptional regulator